MSHQIIRQPGERELYCVYCSIAGGIIWYDCNVEELREVYIQEAADRVVTHLNDVLGKLRKGERPYYQFTMTHEEALEMHGEPLEEDK